MKFKMSVLCKLLIYVTLACCVCSRVCAQSIEQSSIAPSQAPVNSSSTQVGVSPGAGTTATPQIINNGKGTNEVIQTVYCPMPNQLIKTGLYWGTRTGGWKSYSESFDQNIVGFVGAQWVGINVGRMICIYKGNQSLSFTIPVQNDTLSQAPQGGSWGKDLGGYRNCHSTNVLNCPFIVKTKQVNMQQIYKSLDFFKGKPDILNQNGA